MEENVNTKVRSYICYCKNTELRKRSTSGGFFGVLVNHCLECGGVVYGAGFDESFNVIHNRAETYEDCIGFHGSKYSQSNLGDMFSTVKKDLLEGRKVLFTGTPCQVAGLKSFLGKLVDRQLICMDFICLGIPSPGIWSRYLLEISEGRKVESICFKDKRNGWKNFTFVVRFTDGSFYIESGRSNLFMKGLFSKLHVRPSCFECPYRSVEHCSDFTVGDAWGVDKYLPEMIDDKGTTSLLIHSEQGLEIFHLVSKFLVYKELATEQVQEGNKSIYQKINYSPDRQQFFQLEKRIGIQKAIQACIPNHFFKKVLKRVRKYITHAI